MTVRDSGGNVQVDFVWGNFPLQPDDDRGENTLDPALDNHSIATEGWANFPSFLPNYAGDGDTGFETVVPDVRGLKVDAAQAALAAASLDNNVTWVVPVVTAVATSGKTATVVLDDDYNFKAGDVVSVYYNDGDAISGNFVGAKVKDVNGSTLTLTIKETVSPAIEISTSNSYVYANYTGSGEVRYVLSQGTAADTIVNAGDTVALNVLQNND